MVAGTGVEFPRLQQPLVFRGIKNNLFAAAKLRHCNTKVVKSLNLVPANNSNNKEFFSVPSSFRFCWPPLSLPKPPETQSPSSLSLHSPMPYKILAQIQRESN